MKETVLVTGANGFVAAHTAQILSNQYNVRLLTRNPKQPNEYKWDIAEKYIDEKALEGVSYIVHLSGSKLYDGTPLTPERRQLVWDSRVGASELLLKQLKAKGIKLKAFISASALGIYSFTDNVLAIDESGDKGSNFEAELSIGWEKAADQFKLEGIAERVVKLRISLVLGNEGGIFVNLKNQLEAKPDNFKYANDKSYFPWVHVADMAGMFAYAVTDSKLDGVFNTVAPGSTSRESILKLMCYLRQNKMDEFNKLSSSFSGQHLSSEKIEKAGYKFTYPDIHSALKNLMGK